MKSIWGRTPREDSYWSSMKPRRQSIVLSFSSKTQKNIENSATSHKTSKKFITSETLPSDLGATHSISKPKKNVHAVAVRSKSMKDLFGVLLHATRSFWR
jgi:hypothetical protein